MAKTKIKFRASSVGMKEGTLYYQVIHNRVARQIHTEYRLDNVTVSGNTVINNGATPLNEKVGRVVSPGSLTDN